jgi:hypothetical protein
MASLVTYSTELHQSPRSERPRPGRASRAFGVVLYVSTALLVVAAAMHAA